MAHERDARDGAVAGDGPRLVNLSELSAEWQWLKGAFAADIPDWHHVSSLAMPRRLPLLGSREARWRAVREAARLAEAASHDVVLVSHGPRPAAYWGAFGARAKVAAHDVYSFNFTDMPRGPGRRFFASGFRSASRFVVSSTWEREYYADYFDIPIERIEFLHWGVRPPADSDAPPLFAAGAYVCAIGSQARDYATLVDAARLLPGTRFVIVGGAASFSGLSLPANVEVRSGIPLADANNILRHSQLMVLPMNSALARCGHVTVVAALHLGIPVVATECRGLADYLLEGETALSVPQGDARAMADVVARLVEEPETLRRMGEAGRRFAARFCTEQSVIDGFRRSLVARGLMPGNHSRAAA